MSTRLFPNFKGIILVDYCSMYVDVIRVVSMSNQVPKPKTDFKRAALQAFKIRTWLLPLMMSWNQPSSPIKKIELESSSTILKTTCLVEEVDDAVITRALCFQIGSKGNQELS